MNSPKEIKKFLHIYNSNACKRSIKVYDVTFCDGVERNGKMYYDLEVVSDSGKKYRLTKYKSLDDLEFAILKDLWEDRGNYEWKDSEYCNKSLNDIVGNFELAYYNIKEC